MSIVLPSARARISQVPFLFRASDCIDENGIYALSYGKRVAGVFTRNSPKTIVDQRGRLVRIPNGAVLPSVVGGQRAVLLEPAATNLCLRSEEFDHATWLKQNGLAVTPNARTAPDGALSMDLLVGDGSIVSQAVRQEVVFTGDGVKCACVHLAEGTGDSRVAFGIRDGTVGTWRHQVLVTWVAGIPVLTTTAGSGVRFTPLYRAASNTWLIAINADGVIAANLNVYYIYTAGSALAAGTAYAWGAQAENSPVPSSYVRTAASTIPRNADSLYFAFAHAPQVMTAYLRGINLGAYLPDGTNYRTLHIGSSNIATDARFGMGKNTAHMHFAQYDDGTTEVASQAAFSATIALGDVIEQRAVLSSTWTVRSAGAIADGTETLASASSASGSAASWAAGVNRVYLTGGLSSNNGIFAYTHVLIAEGDRATDEIRALAGLG